MGKWAQYKSAVGTPAIPEQATERTPSTFEKIIRPLTYGNNLTAALALGIPVEQAFRENRLVSELIPEKPGPLDEIARFGVDVATDPLTYLTFGTAGIAKAGVATGVKQTPRIVAKFAGKEIASSTKAYEGLQAGQQAIGKLPIMRELGGMVIPGWKFRQYYNQKSPGLGDELYNIVRKEGSGKIASMAKEQEYALGMKKAIEALAKKYKVSDTDAKSIITEMVELKTPPVRPVEVTKTEQSPQAMFDMDEAFPNPPLPTKVKLEFEGAQKQLADSQEAQNIVKSIKDKLEEYRTTEEGAGYTVKYLDDETADYLTRVATKYIDKTDKATASHIKRIFRQGGSTVDVNKYLKERGYADNMFIIDPAFVLGVRGMRNARLLHNRKMLDDMVKTAKELGAEEFDLATAKKAFDAGEVLHIARKDFYASGLADILPASAVADIGQDALIAISKATLGKTPLPETLSKFYKIDEGMKVSINSLFRKSIDPKETSDFLNIIDTATNTWKAWTLAPFPAYHFRNFISNKWNNWLAGVNNPVPYIKSYDIMRKVIFKQPLDKAEKALVQEARNLGVIGTDMFKIELPDQFITNFQKTKKLFSKTIGSQNPLIKYSRKFGSALEDADKLAHYIDKVGKGLSPDDAALSVKKFLFDYTELTPFEKNVMKRALPFYTWCVSEDTECLTKEGWKKYNNISIGEEVLSYNLQNKEYQWDIVKDIFIQDYNYKLFHYKGKSIDLLCTFDHRCVTNKGLRKAYQISLGDTVSTKAKYNMVDYDIPDNILQLISWIVTDGYTRFRNNYYELMIYQKKEPYFSEIKSLIPTVDYSISIHPDTGVNCIRINGDTRKTIVKYYQGKNSLWNLFIKLSSRQLQLCIDTMMKAEGCCAYKDTNKEFKHFAQKGEKVLDVFQLATILSGCISSISSRGIFIRNKETIKYPKPKIVNYNGKIWCPVTNNETWIARRNGKVIITGNSRKNIPLQLENIIKQPGKYAVIAKAKNAIESGDIGRPNEAYMQDWMQRNAPVYIRRDEKTGKAMYMLLGSYLPAADLMKIGNPLTEIVASLNPLFKIPVELRIPGGGYNFFFNDKIERVEGEGTEYLNIVMRKKMAHILKSVRMLNEIDRLLTPTTTQKETTPTTEKWIRFATGAKLYPYDEERAKGYWQRDVRERIFQLMELVQRGRKLKHPEEKIMDYIQQIQAQKRKLAGVR